MAGWSEGDLPESGIEGSLGVSTIQPTRLAWSGLLVRTYSLYQERFAKLFLISLPPAFLAYFFRFIHIQKLIVGGIRHHGWLPSYRSPGYWTILIVVALFDGAVYWVTSGFFLAGIASNVLSTSAENQLAITDAFSKARKRLAGVAGVTLLIWSAFMLSLEIAGFALFAILERLRLEQNYIVFTSTYGLVLLLLGGLFSRFGLAIPILIDDPKASVRDALRRSVRQSEDWEPFFILFLAKSALIGYAAYWLLSQGLMNLSDRGMLKAETYPWIQSLLYICIGAMVESPLFIAFSLLYRDTKTRLEDPVAVEAVH